MEQAFRSYGTSQAVTLLSSGEPFFTAGVIVAVAVQAAVCQSRTAARLLRDIFRYLDIGAPEALEPSETRRQLTDSTLVSGAGCQGRLASGPCRSLMINCCLHRI